MRFGRFLVRQRQRADWIGDLVRVAGTDARFPWAGSPLDMHDHIRVAFGGDSDVHHAMSAALDEWHGGPYPLYLDDARRASEALDREREASAARMSVLLRRDH